ncbi:DUF1707 and DUF4190 domain-containing protein [Streptomyces sp. O3]
MSMEWHGWQAGQNAMMRASHADRERAADVLKAAYAEGRLDKAAYDDRLARVHHAGTYGELSTLLADLPQGPVPVFRPPTYHQPPAYPPAAPHQHPPPQTFWAAPPPQQTTNGYATGALVCGLLTPVTMGMTAIPAVILGHTARAAIARTGERGDGSAVTGLVLGYAAIVFWLVIIGFGMLAAAAGV